MSHEQRHASIGIHGLHQHEAAHQVIRLRLMGRARRLALALGLALAASSAAVLALRLAQAADLKTVTARQAELHVQTVLPQNAPGQGLLQLPGSLQGFAETPIYARSNGYVTRWTKDIGDRVQAGDLLVELSTVEVAQQLAQARATREQAQAALQLARSSLARWQGLRQRDAVSQQEVDERSNTLQQAEGSLGAAQADVQRLEQLLAYSRITAPFAGVVTRRTVDVGNLVDAGNGGPPKALYTLSQTDPLRVYLAVPQAYAPRIKVGQTAQLRLDERPGEVFSGRVVRSAGALDPLTRTLQVEVDLPNRDGRLLPGSYATVGLQTGPGAGSLLTVPGNALLFRPQGTLVAVVGPDGRVRLKPVQIGRDLGAQVEIRDGLGATDTVIINPPDSLNEGDAVQASPVAEKATKPGAGS